MSANVLPSESSIALRIVEERHPLLGAVVMGVDPVRGAGERDAGGAEVRVGGADLVDGEIENRARTPFVGRHGAEEDARLPDGEEGEVAEGEDVRQPQRFAVEGLGPGDVEREQRDLAQGAEGRGVGHGWRLLVAADTVRGDAGPGAKGRCALDPELGGDVAEVVLDRVEARAAPAGDAPPAEAVAQPVEHLPLGGREDVGMGRAAPATTSGHGRTVASARSIYPPPGPRRRLHGWNRRRGSAGAACFSWVLAWACPRSWPRARRWCRRCRRVRGLR